MAFPQELEAAFAATIFELGLKYSSPKTIIPLLPNESAVNKEHIKSHLQKYRIHHQRSREEFMVYYNLNFRDKYNAWLTSKEMKMDEISEFEHIISPIVPSTSTGNSPEDLHLAREGLPTNIIAEGGRKSSLGGLSQGEISSSKMPSMVNGMQELVEETKCCHKRWRDHCKQFFEQVEYTVSDIVAQLNANEELELLADRGTDEVINSLCICHFQ
jgi:SHAQKYF class myb-like DNA-binding protein